LIGPTTRYDKDENAEPPVMVLQPITSKLPHFLNKLIPEEQEADQRKWWSILSGLQDTLRYISTYLYKASNWLYSFTKRFCPRNLS
jgi:hypothetical protein